MAHYTLIGAGPVGTLMALLLEQRGQQVRLFERRADPRLVPASAGRSINLALSARGLLALEQAGVRRRLEAHMIAMPGRLLHDERGTTQFLPYGRQAHEVNYALSRELLNRVLIEAAAERPLIELTFQTRCVGVDLDARQLQLQHEAHGRLSAQPFEYLLGTDGAPSAVRAGLLAAGLSSVREDWLEHDYKELLIAPSAGSSGFVFDAHALHIWPRGGYMLIALPNTDGSFTATLFLARHGDPSFQQLDSTARVSAFFAREFADVQPHMPDLARQFRDHPQSRIGTLHCSAWHAGDVLLLGDAAHAIVPFHGQGLNCGLEDCRLLDQLLRQYAPAQAFARFESERRADAQAIATMALENYEEMRASVREPQFAQRQALAAQLEQHFPQRFIARYAMVTFHPEIGYAEAQRRGERQRQVLQQLMATFGAGPLSGPALAQTQRLLDVAGL